MHVHICRAQVRFGARGSEKRLPIKRGRQKLRAKMQTFSQACLLVSQLAPASFLRQERISFSIHPRPRTNEWKITSDFCILAHRKLKGTPSVDHSSTLLLGHAPPGHGTDINTLRWAGRTMQDNHALTAREGGWRPRQSEKSNPKTSCPFGLNSQRLCVLARAWQRRDSAVIRRLDCQSSGLAPIQPDGQLEFRTRKRKKCIRRG